MDEQDVAVRFNDAINRRDLDALVALMTHDHRFIDSDGNAFEGRERGRDIWRQFFLAFPDYQNHFETLGNHASTVTITGHSTCSDARLAGPALWTATIRDHKVSEWRVYVDTPAIRDLLGIA